MSNRVAIYRKEHFNAAHRLHNAAWSDEENQRYFGKCNHANYHGHNYDVVVKLVGEPDPETGFVYDIKVLSDLIIEHIIEPFDHKNLNLDVKEFATLNPTAENIAIVTFNRLRDQLPKHLELFVRIYETERNFVDYPA